MPDPFNPSSIRIGLLGAGIFASSAHKTQILKLLQASKVRVELVWSRSQQSAQNLARQYGPNIPVAYHDPSIYSNPLQSACAALRQYRSNLDAVVLALPIPQLAQFASAVLEEGLHLLQEKPLAADAESATDLLSISTSPQLVHAVAENFRFEPVFKHASQMIPAVCKNVIALHLTAHSPMPPGSRYGKGWRLDIPGVGILMDGIVHHIAGMRVVLQSHVQSVQAVCSRRGTTFTGCDTVSGTLTFANGVPANIFVTYVSNTFIWELRVIGTEGDIVVRRTSDTPGYTLSSLNHSAGGFVTEDVQFPFSGVDSEFEAFVDSCISQRVHPDLDAYEAFNDLATVQAMFESSNKGGNVSVRQPPDRALP